MKWNQVKYLYMTFIVFTHFVFSVVYTVYALLMYSTLCEPYEKESKDERWNISATVSVLFTKPRITSTNFTHG